MMFAHWTIGKARLLYSVAIKVVIANSHAKLSRHFANCGYFQQSHLEISKGTVEVRPQKL